MSEQASLPSEETVLLARTAAGVLLESCGVEFSRIVRVCTDGAILFLKKGSKGEFPMTGWTEVHDEKMCVRVQSGWPVEQKPYLTIRGARADSPGHGDNSD